ncbi:MAG: class I SAM-dependent methyltransferase [candidate division KSB1 bacterium]|nr:class I SAM-dependent methyltransferase [candidate division KSB1 bacterium]MDZ7345677.1 class I SAM-dependent methyltransferase [candidate division KSB1 bacterium]
MQKNYNERLFSNGIRSRYHFARYYWLKKKLIKLGCPCRRVLELGCFDAKTLNFLPKEPEYYLGYDADWEGGLQMGRAKWANRRNVDLRFCNSPEHLADAEPFDVAVCMETLEHLPVRDIKAYLEFLRCMTGDYCFITIPVERGVILPFKYAYKSIIGAVTTPYRFKELAAATLGRMKSVPRIETTHKGFDYRQCLQTIGLFFDVIEMEGIPFGWLPPYLNPTIGIVAKPKTGIK